MNYDNNYTGNVCTFEPRIDDQWCTHFFYKFVTCELLFDKHHFCYDISTALLTDPV